MKTEMKKSLFGIMPILSAHRLRPTLVLPALAALCYTAAMAAQQEKTVKVDPTTQAVKPFEVQPLDDLRLIIEPKDKKRYDIAWSEIFKQSDDTVLWQKTSHAANQDIYDVANAYPGTEFMSVKGSLTTGGGGGGNGQLPIFQVTVPEVDVDWNKSGYCENSDEPGEDTRILWIRPDTVYPFLVRRPIEETDDMFVKIGSTLKRPLPDLEFYVDTGSGLLAYATEADALAGVNAITFSHLIKRETWDDKSVNYLPFFAKQDPAQQTLPQMTWKIRLKRIDRDVHGNPTNVKNSDGDMVFTGFEDDVTRLTHDDIKYRLLRLDIDVDTDNEGTIASDNDGEDEYEQYEPGLLLDRYDAQAEASGLLKEIKLSGFPQGNGLNAKLVKTGPARLRIYSAPNLASEQLLPGTVWTDANPPPQSLWVRGCDTNGKAVLQFSVFDPAKPAETIAADEVCLTVLEPASYSPSGSKLLAIWAPCRPADGMPMNAFNNFSQGTVNEVFDNINGQGGGANREIVWYEDTDGDQNLTFGSCNRANFTEMANAGTIVVFTHGSPGSMSTVFAEHTPAGYQACDNWIAGISGAEVWEQGSSNGRPCWVASIPSSWIETSWKPRLDQNRGIAVWSACSSGVAAGNMKSLMDAGGGRWRVGNSDISDTLVTFDTNRQLFRRMNGLDNDGALRTAGKAWANPSYPPLTVMQGNPWTTLCPAPSEKNKLMFPANIAQNRKGWACLAFDTYADGTVNPATIISGNNISGQRWVQLGAGYRVIGFYFDKTNGNPITLTVDAQNCISEGANGGQWLDFDGVKPNGSVHTIILN